MATRMSIRRPVLDAQHMSAIDKLEGEVHYPFVFDVTIHSSQTVHAIVKRVTDLPLLRRISKAEPQVLR